MFEDVGIFRGVVTLALMIGGAVGMAYTGILVPLRVRPKHADPGGRPAPIPEPPADHGGPALLSIWEFAGILALCVAIFVGLLGPAWNGSYDIDRAVALSYLPIPPLVLACLLYRGRLRVRSLVVGSFVVACAKFGITAILVIGALAMWGPSHTPIAQRVSKAIVKMPEPPTPIPPEIRGAITGVVVDDFGRPLANASVYIRSGLEEYRFAARTDVLELTGDSTGLHRATVVVQAGQPMRLRSTDGMLHTLVGLGERDRVRFNLPLLWGDGAPTRTVHHAVGDFIGVCSVHAHLHRERDARVLVLHHPYFARTDREGRFALEGVPGNTELELVVASPGGDGLSVLVPLTPGERLDVQLVR